MLLSQCSSNFKAKSVTESQELKQMRLANFPRNDTSYFPPVLQIPCVRDWKILRVSILLPTQLIYIIGNADERAVINSRILISTLRCFTMPSGTNSQGNHYSTPGGTNSGTGSYHCK
eukprot:scaffold1301_cov128-Cylindrotheca_fusiformis.AAC.2